MHTCPSARAACTSPLWNSKLRHLWSSCVCCWSQELPHHLPGTCPGRSGQLRDLPGARPGAGGTTELVHSMAWPAEHPGLPCSGLGRAVSPPPAGSATATTLQWPAECPAPFTLLPPPVHSNSHFSGLNCLICCINCCRLLQAPMLTWGSAPFHGTINSSQINVPSLCSITQRHWGAHGSGAPRSHLRTPSQLAAAVRQQPHSKITLLESPINL